MAIVVFFTLQLGISNPPLLGSDDCVTSLFNVYFLHVDTKQQMSKSHQICHFFLTKTQNWVGDSRIVCYQPDIKHDKPTCTW